MSVQSCDGFWGFWSSTAGHGLRRSWSGLVDEIWHRDWRDEAVPGQPALSSTLSKICAFGRSVAEPH